MKVRPLHPCHDIALGLDVLASDCERSGVRHVVTVCLRDGEIDVRALGPDGDALASYLLTALAQPVLEHHARQELLHRPTAPAKVVSLGASEVVGGIVRRIRERAAGVAEDARKIPRGAVKRGGPFDDCPRFDLEMLKARELEKVADEIASLIAKGKDDGHTPSEAKDVEPAAEESRADPAARP